ncbi:membrane protein insertase YidC [Striga asiatica]|uniref:Membrane protein insertase YidC n=1 Tax=Striga asiatica TaxID=4170 RepID=A0A5A7PFN5_STRAF|nr:membrane protein insertase YidC [Striga asiatica]
MSRADGEYGKQQRSRRLSFKRASRTIGDHTRISVIGLQQWIEQPISSANRVWARDSSPRFRNRPWLKMVQSFAREDQRSVIPAAIEFSDRSAAVVSRIAVGENSTRRKKNSRFAGRRAGDRRVVATAVSRRTVVSSRD